MEPSETGPVRTVKRNYAKALRIVCIVLAAGLVGATVVLGVENANLQNQVNNLTQIVNNEKTVSETCLSNKTFSIDPQANVYEVFYTPHSGDVLVDTIIKPANTYILWVNLTWYVYYGMPPRLYGFSPEGDVLTFQDKAGNYHYQEGFPMVTFNQIKNLPNVSVMFGNSSNDTVITANVTITVYY